VQRKCDRDFTKDVARSQEIRIFAALFPASRKYLHNSHGNFALGAILDNFYVSRHFRQNTYCRSHLFSLFLLPRRNVRSSLRAPFIPYSHYVPGNEEYFILADLLT